jgi:hypothetical protein
MNQIKKVLLTAIATVGVFSATFTSCTPDPCKDVICNNGGSCLDGACQCASGFEGTNCETSSRAKFIGNYTVLDTAQAVASYSCTITASSTDPTKVIISNPANLNLIGTNTSVTGTVSGNTLTIAKQAVVGTAAIEYSATATILATNLATVNYTVFSGGVSVGGNPGAVWTKQ